jgi:hypothetical protein
MHPLPELPLKDLGEILQHLVKGRDLGSGRFQLKLEMPRFPAARQG